MSLIVASRHIIASSRCVELHRHVAVRADDDDLDDSEGREEDGEDGNTVDEVSESPNIFTLI
jgi:hypothetical protein